MFGTVNVMSSVVLIVSFIGCLITLSVSRLYRVRYYDDPLVSMDLEGSHHGIIEAVSQHFYELTEESHKKEDSIRIASAFSSIWGEN
jgi:hypothetical protein